MRRRPGAAIFPAGLYLATLCAVILALARPVATILLPDDRIAVMLSIDVSASMQERDFDPTRLDGAKHAAKEFVRTLPRGAKAGLVSFSDTATPVVPPTESHDLVLQAIDGLAIASSTAIGDGILEAVYAQQTPSTMMHSWGSPRSWEENITMSPPPVSWAERIAP